MNAAHEYEPIPLTQDSHLNTKIISPLRKAIRQKFTLLADSVKFTLNPF